jgi:AraC family transcriptional regulator
MRLSEPPLRQTAERRQPGTYFGDESFRLAMSGCLLTESQHAAGSRTPMHFHERPYVALVCDGYYRPHGDDSSIIRPLMLIVHPAGERHGDEFGIRTTTMFNLELSEAWDARLPALGVFESGQVVLSDPELGGLAAQLRSEMQHPDVISPMAVEGLTLELLARIARRARGERTHASLAPWLKRTRDRLHACPQESHTLEDLARDAGVHPAHLAESFRRVFGTTPARYLRALRTERALALLRDHALSLSSIAIACGFADQSHLTRMVRQRTGLTPLRYRQRAAASVRSIAG